MRKQQNHNRRQRRKSVNGRESTVEQLEVMRLVEQSMQDPLPPPPPEPEPFEVLLRQVSQHRRPIVAGLIFFLFLILVVARPWRQSEGLSEAELMQLAQSRRGSVPRAPRAGVSPVTGGTNLRVSSSPLRAAVFVGGDSVGVTPLWLSDLPEGRHSIAARLDGYLPLDTVVTVGGRTDQRLYLLLMPTPGASRGLDDFAPAPEEDVGVVELTSEPAGASILIDGATVGTTPAVLRNVRAGTRDVVLQLEGHESYTKSVRVRSGGTSTVHAELIPNAGTLLVLVKPWGSIYIDGALHVDNTDIQYRATLETGTHWVRAVHPVLGAHEEVVHITTEQPVELVFDLNQGARALESEAEAEDTGKASVADVNGIYIVAEAPPRLIGGLEELQGKVSYPEAAARDRLQGRVYMRFVVDEQGRVVDPMVTHGLSPECDREALRVAGLARFRPAEVGGKPVRAWYNLYLNFQNGD